MCDAGSQTDFAHDDHGFEAVPCPAFSLHGFRDINGEEKGGFGGSGPVSAGPEGVVPATVGSELEGCGHVDSISVREICDVFETSVESHVFNQHVADAVNQGGVLSDDFGIGVLEVGSAVLNGCVLARSLMGGDSGWS